MLTDPIELCARARAAGRGVGAFNVIQVEHAEAFAEAAERAGCALVMQISENAAKYHGSLAPIALATLAVARESSAPIVVHLDHAEDRALVTEAIALGMNSVMYDGSKLDYAANLAATADVVREAHAAGVSVEAELGEVGGKDGVHAPGARTRPFEAVDFVAATGIDALAVAVGSSHAMTERTACLDLDLIRELHAAVLIPLVLHGSSGVPDDALTRAVEAGMTKINISTHLNKTMTAAIAAFMSAQPGIVDPRKYLGAGRSAMVDEVVRLLGVLKAAR